MDQLPAAVLVVLRYLMQQAVVSAAGGQVAMVGPGERGSVERGVLIWLYHAAPAVALRRPSRPGSRAAGMSVDLNVLITCVGDERRYEPARILGGCIRILDAHPMLRVDDAKDALRAIDGHGLDATAVLEHWVDLPLLLHNLSVAELSQLWGAGGGAKGLSTACRIQAVPCGSSAGSSP